MAGLTSHPLPTPISPLTRRRAEPGVRGPAEREGLLRVAPGERSWWTRGRWQTQPHLGMAGSTFRRTSEPGALAAPEQVEQAVPERVERVEQAER